MSPPTLPIDRTSLRVTWLFPEVKRDLTGTKFEMDADVVKAVEAC